MTLFRLKPKRRGGQQIIVTEKKTGRMRTLEVRSNTEKDRNRVEVCPECQCGPAGTHQHWCSFAKEKK